MFFFESVEHMVAYRPSLVFPRAMVPSHEKSREKSTVTREGEMLID